MVSSDAIFCWSRLLWGLLTLYAGETDARDTFEREDLTIDLSPIAFTYIQTKRKRTANIKRRSYTNGLIVCFNNMLRNGKA